MREELGPDHPNVGQSLTNLAGIYHDQGRYAEAEPLYQPALEIWETARRSWSCAPLPINPHPGRR